MKSEKMYDAITDIREDIILRAEEPQKKQPRRRGWWSALVAAVLAAALLGGALLWPGGSPVVLPAYAIALPQYPEMAPYPDQSDFMGENGQFDGEGLNAAYEEWWADIAAQRRPRGYADGLEGFLSASAQQFLSGGAGNRVYSPLNVYMALGMLAELTAGNSRQQILDLLDSGSIEELRQQASDLWNSNYRQDGLVSTVLASSLWLNKDVAFNQAAMDTLAKNYYASSYRGEMGSEGFDKALQDWLNAQTGGLLEEQAAGITMDPATILALATTIYFQASWSTPFSAERTQPDLFHGESGDITCDFMRDSGLKPYAWGEGFSAVKQPLENDGGMWLILPGEGVTVAELLSSPSAMEFLTAPDSWQDSRMLTVNLSVPKFDVTSQLDLLEGLAALGVTDVLDPGKSDFTPMTTDVDGLYLGEARHDARVVIDEEGCTAVAYTVMMVPTAGLISEDEVDFVVDRPFIFVITGNDGLPLFVGAVETPVS